MRSPPSWIAAVLISFYFPSSLSSSLHAELILAAAFLRLALRMDHGLIRAFARKLGSYWLQVKHMITFNDIYITFVMQ